MNLAIESIDGEESIKPIIIISGLYRKKHNGTKYQVSFKITIVETFVMNLSQDYFFVER